MTHVSTGLIYIKLILAECIWMTVLHKCEQYLYYILHALVYSSGYMQPGQPPPPASQHYGTYGSQFQQSAFSANAWQVRQIGIYNG